MAQGLACVGTRHCDIPELIRHQVTGWLAESGDIAALARHLGEIAAAPEKTMEIRAAGIRHMRENFRRSEQVRRLREIYDECLGPSA